MLTRSTTHQRIFLALQPVDMRGGFDRLTGHVRAAGLDPRHGDLFVFLSKRRTHLKVLTHDGSGVVVLYKRLSRGTFHYVGPRGDARPIVLDAAQLATMLDGQAIAGQERSDVVGGPGPGIDTDGGA